MQAKKAAIIDGSAALFVGPIMDQSGEIKVAAGHQATDAELLKMNYFVKGVIGTLE